MLQSGHREVLGDVERDLLGETDLNKVVVEVLSLE